MAPCPKLEKMLRRVSSEALRLIRLSNDLLDTERINSGNFEIAPLCASILRKCAPTLEALTWDISTY